MRKKWAEQSAVNFLKQRNVDFKGKFIIAKDGFTGLTSCSACDYLVNYCGYKVI